MIIDTEASVNALCLILTRSTDGTRTFVILAILPLEPRLTFAGVTGAGVLTSPLVLTRRSNRARPYVFAAELAFEAGKASALEVETSEGIARAAVLARIGNGARANVDAACFPLKAGPTFAPEI